MNTSDRTWKKLAKLDNPNIAKLHNFVTTFTDLIERKNKACEEVIQKAISKLPNEASDIEIAVEFSRILEENSCKAACDYNEISSTIKSLNYRDIYNTLRVLEDQYPQHAKFLSGEVYKVMKKL